MLTDKSNSIVPGKENRSGNITINRSLQSAFQRPTLTDSSGHSRPGGGHS